MLEAVRDQAHGLQAWELRPPTRVLPVVATPESERSLELLWRLERAFRSMELPVTVLEGVGGLSPADRRAGHRHVLGCWLQSVQEGSVVLLHAPLEALSVLLADSLARPLVALTPEPAAVVGAYNAVKVLHQAAALQPIVLTIAPEEGAFEGASPEGRQQSAAHALCETARQRLGWVPVVWTVGYHSYGNGPFAPAASLSTWLKLLDSALILEEDPRAHDDIRRQRCPNPADQTIGVPDVHRQRHA